MSRVFIDTNVLAYAIDGSNKDKKKKARKILKEISASSQGVISTQVIQEFYVVATRKLGVSELQAKNLIQLLDRFEIVVVTPELISAAIDCSIISQLSFWDSLIVVSAENGNCESLLSEDLNSGQTVRGVKFLNPFI